MSSPNSRKRPAPGANPIVPVPPIQQQFAVPAVQADNTFRWTGGLVDGTAGFVDTTGSPNVTPYTMMPTQGQYGQAVPAPSSSTALTRRQNNSRALVPSGNRAPPFGTTSEPWADFGEDFGNLQPSSNGTPDEHDNIERLEEMAQRAKREATAKRKQIPPFVQKLSSFLDESRNTELIRWSDKGDSFIVLDEDEFAKTLIPELFKHNNYASFVRQLNMYGFHKRVGLSDNSMKASERKNKSPSEYYNPYFRRGHPNLLWLINKPKGGNAKNKSKAGKKEEGEGESDEDGVVDETYPAHTFTPAPVNNRVTPVVNEVGPLQKKDLVQVKSQIERLQQQQLAIHTMLQKLRTEHYQQAILFQNMHERHENSINAILNFLANVYRKSLEEQGGAHSVQDLLASIIPNAQGHTQHNMPQGSVLELSDFLSQQNQNVANMNMGTPKRQQRLLPPVPHNASGKANTLSPASTPSPVPHSYRQPQVGSVITEVFDNSPSDTTSPAYMKNELQNNPQEGMMKIIHDTNATSTSGIDLPNLAAKTPVTSMDADQRNKMLSIMAGGQNSKPTPPSFPASSIASPSPSIPAAPTALNTPAIPNTTGVPLIPPIMPSISPPPLESLRYTQAELENLSRLTQEQQAEIGSLSNLLGPLSPSGRIPGLDDQGNANTSYFDNTDFDQFINTDALSNPHAFDTQAGPFGGISGAADGNDFNFSLDGTGNDFFSATAGGGAGQQMGSGGGGGGGGIGGFEPGRVFETNSPVNTPSPSATEEITRNDLDGLGTPTTERDSKRRRRQ
ncbi:hypothetical protein B0H66DRAFT_535968 [Apodospora peruviana]|uniref:HSF-type DNA-binding domain-containing protein n=1 Tax=Apodospora peruviana TaxID=516989 RepID=A0AAE0M1Y8_9PEZI|nr:hypothetical protein B0H66DRAFT_535968 [Apodospora peruviana]